jgi:hypothetical protein
VLIGLWFSVGANAATCTNEDLQGEWNFKYIIKTPPQVGMCNLSFHSDTSVTGLCENVTYSESSDVFDGNATISDKCVIKGKIIDENGGVTTLSAKLNKTDGVIKGTATQKIGSRSFKSDATAKRKGDAVCK